MLNIQVVNTQEYLEYSDGIAVSREKITEIVASEVKNTSEIIRENDVKQLIFVEMKHGAMYYARDFITGLYKELYDYPGFYPILDSLEVLRYGNKTVSSSHIKIIKDMDNADIAGKWVFILEDILDEGIPLSELSEALKLRNFRHLHISSLLGRYKNRIVNFPADVTISIGHYLNDPRWVFGYGPDFRGRFRPLPDIHFLKPEHQVQV